METIIILAQFVSLAACGLAGLLVLGAIPYALGREVGKRAAVRALGDLSVADKCRFQLRIAEIMEKGARRSLNEARTKAGI